jgi:hypothetical protein
MSYIISEYTKRKAKKLGVIVKPSTNKKKKIDVYIIDDAGKEKKIASVGGVKKDGSYYNDYPTYLKNDGKEKAEMRRRLYRIRHAKDLKRVPGGIEKQSPGFFAAQLLW